MVPDARWRRYWRYLTRGFRREVDEELQFHMEMRARELAASGMPPEAAEREARRRFGNVEKVRHSLETIERQRGRRMAWSFHLDELRHDLRYGVRALLKRPGFTLAAVLSLALGIATVTIVYGIVNIYLLQPLPVPHPEELVVIGNRRPGPPAMTVDGIDFPNFRRLKERTNLFSDVAGFSVVGVSLREGDETAGHLSTVVAVTGSYFSMLGVSPALGRVVAPLDDDQHNPVLVLTHAYWRRRFGADPSVLGKTIRLNGKAFTVVGVAPPGFVGTISVIVSEGFIPRTTMDLFYPGANGVDGRLDFTAMGVDVIARRRADVTLDQLRAGLDLATRDLVREYPAENRGLNLIAYPESKSRPSISVADSVPMVALIFLSLAFLVLVVACANVANLLLVRATARRNELGIRQALGASRGRLVRQLLTETILLAFGGLGLGWILARVGMSWLSGIELVSDIMIRLTVTPDWRVLIFAAAGAVSAGVLAGIFPALTMTKGDLRAAVGEGTRSIGGGNRYRNLLVTVQLAVSLVALVAAGLFVRSIRHAVRMDLGFRPEHVLRAGIVPNMGGYTHAEGLVLFDKLEDRIQALPGVQRVAWATTTPLQAVNIKMGDVYVDGLAASPTEPNRDHISLMIDWISDSYFDVMGTRLISGRAFTAQDDSTAPRVAIVNATAAKTLWPGKEPIGQRFRTSRSGPLVEVVGVAQDGRYLFVNEPLRPFVYYPIKQDNGDERTLLVQTTGDPAALAGSVRATLAALAPDLAPIGLLSMNAYLRGSVSFLMLRLAAMLAGAIGLLTLVQASIGLYGVLTYTVAQRAREIGIRIALGADRGRVLRLIVGQGGYLIAAGLGIGLVLAYVASRGLQTFLVGVSAGDLLTFGVALGVLGAIALLATYLPARRAARMDPVKALRADS